MGRDARLTRLEALAGTPTPHAAATPAAVTAARAAAAVEASTADLSVTLTPPERGLLLDVLGNLHVKSTQPDADRLWSTLRAIVVKIQGPTA